MLFTIIALVTAISSPQLSARTANAGTANVGIDHSSVDRDNLVPTRGASGGGSSTSVSGPRLPVFSTGTGPEAALDGNAAGGQLSAHVDARPKIDFLSLLLWPSALLRPPASRAPARAHEAEGPGADRGGEAGEFRLLTMKDEHGRIPPGAFMRANQHRRNNLQHGHSSRRMATAAASISTTSWVSRGPQNVGGRTLAVIVHPTNNQLLFAGSASGGIWKSTNGGTSWAPVNDFMANLYIGVLVFDPLNPSTMYAGTGERFYDREVKGAGIFRSTDGGTTWNQLSATAGWAYVSGIAFQPGSSSVLLVSTGDGIYRTTDGGATWSTVSVPALSSAFSVAFNPAAGTRAVAAVQRNDGRVQAYYSTDGGVSFSAASGTSLAGADMAIAYAPSAASTVYAIANASLSYSEIWKSTDNGVNYTRLATGDIGCVDRRCAIWVSPTDPNLVVTGGTCVYRSKNGGSTFSLINNAGDFPADPHADIHFISADSAYNGSTNRTVYFGTDGGVWKSTDIVNAYPTSTTWTRLNAGYQTAQFYGGAGHAVGSGAYFGGTQDNGTLATTNGTNNAREVSGDDGGFVDIDPNAVDTWYVENQYLELKRTTNGGTNIDYIYYGLTDAGDNPRHNFVSPFVLDPNNPATLYAGARSLWRTTNANASSVSWSAIRTGSENISAIAVAPGDSNLVYVAQNDATIQKTTNALGTPVWTDVDNNTSIDPLPNRYVTRIYIDPNDNNIVYVALGGFAFPNLWKSSNGGSTFAPVSGSGTTSLPPAPIRAIVRHPRDAQRLYAGTDVGIYESEDGGQSWSATQAGPADVSIDEIRFVVGTETLLAATHGRGLWTADVSSVPTPAPTELAAVATSTSEVDVTWHAVTGASYKVFRSSDGADYGPPVATVYTASYHDSGLTPGKTYLYKVKATVNSTSSSDSNVDLATTIIFIDDNQLVGKRIRATYLQQIRDAVNDVRVAAGLPPLTFTNPATAGSRILAADINDLRAGLVAAYNNLHLTAPPFAETITGNSTRVKASHWQEIRNAVK